MTKLFRNLSLRVKLVVLVSAVVAVLSTFLVIFFPMQMGAMAESSAQRRGETMAILLSDALAPNLEFEDVEGIHALFEKVAGATDIDYAAVRLFDNSGRSSDVEVLELDTYYAWHEDRLPSAVEIPVGRHMAVTVGDELRVTARIDARDGQSLGLLIIGISLADLREKQRRNLWLVILVSVILFLVGVGASIAIGTITVRPIRALTQIAGNIVAEGDLTQRITVDSTDEVGQLALSFNAMVEKLQALPRSLTELVVSVTSVTEKAEGTLTTVSSGASTIHARVAGAASAMHQMNTSLESIATSVDEVHKNATESATANEQLVRATQSINGRVANMASSVEGAEVAALKMTAALKEISGRVAELDTIVETTASAMTEMNASIQNVEMSAIETNDLSRQVAEDAETGVAA
ncbi:MAG: HAMP domain-containing protein, partial [Myxococcota bacterium]